MSMMMVHITAAVAEHLCCAAAVLNTLQTFHPENINYLIDASRVQ